MIGTNHYTPWLRRHAATVTFDLASSGIPPLSARELADLPSPPSGADEAGLTCAIAAYNGVSAAECLPTLGTLHAVFLAYASLLSSGDHVLVERPSYEPLWRLPQALGAEVTFFERTFAQRYQVDVDTLLAQLTERTRLLVLSNLHNPTGVRLSDDVLRLLATRLLERGVYLLVDEVYAPFDTMTDGRGVFGRSARRLGENVIAAASLTKCFGVGSERQGFLLASPELLDRAREVLRNSVGALPRSHAAEGLRLFSAAVTLSTRGRAALSQKRALVEAFLMAHPDYQAHLPPEGLFVFVETRGLEADLTARIEAAARNRDVLVAPGRFFGFPAGFRLSWALDHALLEEALTRLADALT